MESRALEAETRTSEIEARATENESRATEAESRMAEAGTRVAEAESRAAEADARAAKSEELLEHAVASGSNAQRLVGQLEGELLTAKASVAELEAELETTRAEAERDRVLADAKAVADAGAFAVVVECVPAEMAARVTAAVSIPTIGIGAGAGCDGQVLVAHDMLGLFDDVRPKFAKRYAELGEAVRQAAEAYTREVRDGTFRARQPGRSTCRIPWST